MALVAPSQQRTIDPYSENRYSSTINRLSRVITAGEDVILHPLNAFTFSIVDFETLRVGPGIVIKDDVLIHITDTYDIDLNDEQVYVDETGAMDSAGSYYIVLEYTYSRSLPAPKAYYRVIKQESLYTNYTDNYIYLGNLNIVWDSGEGRYGTDSFVYVYGSLGRPQQPGNALVVDGGEV